MPPVKTRRGIKWIFLVLVSDALKFMTLFPRSYVIWVVHKNLETRLYNGENKLPFVTNFSEPETPNKTKTKLIVFTCWMQSCVRYRNRPSSLVFIVARTSWCSSAGCYKEQMAVKKTNSIVWLNVQRIEHCDRSWDAKRVSLSKYVSKNDCSA